jgi:hypothetical protein
MTLQKKIEKPEVNKPEVSPEVKREISPIVTVKSGEYGLMSYLAVVTHGATLEDVLKPGYWAYVSDQFKPMITTIEIVAEDCSWFATLRVIECGRGYARVVKTAYTNLDATDRGAPKKSIEYTVNYGGPSVMWRVIRKSDDEVIMKDLQNKEEANKWLEDYEARI